MSLARPDCELVPRMVVLPRDMATIGTPKLSCKYRRAEVLSRIVDYLPVSGPGQCLPNLRAMEISGVGAATTSSEKKTGPMP